LAAPQAGVGLTLEKGKQDTAHSEFSAHSEFHADSTTSFCRGFDSRLPSFGRLCRWRSNASQALAKASGKLAPLVMISGMSGNDTLYAGSWPTYLTKNT
jgi:hypothetical protein